MFLLEGDDMRAGKLTLIHATLLFLFTSFPLWARQGPENLPEPDMETPPPTGEVDAGETGKTRFTVTGREIRAFSGDTMVGSFELPSSPVRWEVRGQWLIAACNRHGLHVLDVLDPLRMKLVTVLERNRDVVDFRIEGDLLVVISGMYEVGTYRVDMEGGQPVSVEEIMRDPGMKLQAYGQEKTRERIGQVTRVHRGFATIEVNSGVRIGVGDFVEVRSAKREKNYDPVTGKTVVRPSADLMCVARVVQAEENRLAIRLGRGDDPKAGDFVYFSELPLTGSLWLPERYRDQWRGQIEAIPLIGAGEDGDRNVLSMVLRGSVHYHGNEPYKVQLGIDPLQILGTSRFESSNQIGANLFAIASYETKYFEIGAGFGYQMPLLKGESPHNRYGGLFIQRMRLGAEDGLHILFQYQAVYSQDNKENKRRAMVGMIHSELNVPMTDGVNLFTRFFGDGRTLIHVGLGLRTILRGNGGPGSFLVPVTLGYTRFSPYYSEDTSYGFTTKRQYKVEGTTFSAGLEYRF